MKSKKEKQIDSFIKKYLTPRYGRRYRVEDRCINERFSNLMKMLSGIELDILNYISNLRKEEYENTRGYFYLSRYKVYNKI